MFKEMTGFAVSSSLMALLFLSVLYVLFHLGATTKNRYGSSNAIDSFVEGDCSIEGRLTLLSLAWNDTINSKVKVNMDTNVYYQLWYSNVLKRGLDAVYTDMQLFKVLYEHSVNRALDKAKLKELITPYYEKELQLSKLRFEKQKASSIQPICMN